MRARIAVVRALLSKMLTKEGVTGETLYVQVGQRGYRLEDFLSALQELKSAKTVTVKDDIDRGLLITLLQQMLARGYTSTKLYAELVKKAGYGLKEFRSALQELKPANLSEIDQELLTSLLKQMLAEQQHGGKQLSQALIVNGGYKLEEVEAALNGLKSSSPEKKSKEDEEKKEQEERRAFQGRSLFGKPPLHPPANKISPTNGSKADKISPTSGNKVDKASPTNGNKSLQSSISNAAISTSGDKGLHSMSLPVSNIKTKSLSAPISQALSSLANYWLGSSAAQAEQPSSLPFDSGSPLHVSQTTPISSPTSSVHSTSSGSGSMTFQFPTLLDGYARGSSTGTSKQLTPDDSTPTVTPTNNTTPTTLTPTLESVNGSQESLDAADNDWSLVQMAKRKNTAK